MEVIGRVLREFRQGAGLSLGALAARVHYSKAFVGHVESGHRQPSADYMAACDQALGTGPLLALLWDIDHLGDDVKRRAFLTAAVSTSMLGVAAAPAVADILRLGLLETTGDEEDWDAVTLAYERRLGIDPSPEFAGSVLGQMMILRQQVSDRGSTPTRLTALARMTHLYGLWLGGQGKLIEARAHYRTAGVLAHRSGDDGTSAYVLSRTAGRGPYEGYTARETMRLIDEALYLNGGRPTHAALESHAALVHLHALTGNLDDGKRAIVGMRRVSDGLSGDDAARAAQRVAHFDSYLHSRIGDPAVAEKAFSLAEPLLRGIPVWHADLAVYRARSMIGAGAVAEGVTVALHAVKALGADVHVVRVGVQDALSVVPSGYNGDDLSELSGYAASGPGPWDTVAA